MKTLFTILVVALSCLQTWAESSDSAVKKATLSYSIPTKLDWEQSTDQALSKETQFYTLEDDKSIRLSSIQAGNDKMWDKFATLDKEQIYKELVDGKKVVHKMMGYKNWKAEKSIQKKSAKEIIFDITGSFQDGNEKKFFSEKYYVTPYGLILMSLDWSDKTNKASAKKAQEEFKNISFKSETL